MRKRSRTLAGFIATAAFVFSLVAGIQASVCAADVELGSSGTPTGSMGKAHGHEALMHGIDQHGEEEGMPACPLMPLAVGPSCTLAFSLPASVHGVTSSTVEVRDISVVENKPDLLFATALFHPPKS